MNDFATPAISGTMDAYLAGFDTRMKTPKETDESSLDPLNRLHKATLTIKNLQDIEAYTITQKNAFYTAQKNELDLQDRVMWNSFITPDEERRKTDPTYMTPYEAMVRGIESLPGRVVSTIRTGGAIDAFASEMATLSASLDLMRRATGGSDPMYTALAARMDEASNLMFPQTDPEIVDQVSAALGFGWRGQPGYDKRVNYGDDLATARSLLAYEAGLAIASSDTERMSSVAATAFSLGDRPTGNRLLSELAAVSGRLSPEGKAPLPVEELTWHLENFRATGDTRSFITLSSDLAGKAALARLGDESGTVAGMWGVNSNPAKAIPQFLGNRQDELLNEKVGIFAVKPGDPKHTISMFEVLSWSSSGVPPEGTEAATALRAALRSKDTRKQALDQIYASAERLKIPKPSIATALTAFEKGLTLTTKKVTDAEVMSWLGKNIINTEAREIWQEANSASADKDDDALAAALQKGRELMQRTN